MEFVVSGGHPALSPNRQCQRMDMRARGRPRTICVCVFLYTQDALPARIPFGTASPFSSGREWDGRFSVSLADMSI